MLRSHTAGLDLQFLKRIGKRHLHAGSADEVDMPCAIERVFHAETQSTCRRNVIRSGEIFWHGNIGLNRGAGKRDQVCHVSSVERQLEDSRILDNLADARASRLYESGVRLDLDLFTDLADFKNQVDDRIAVDLQNNSRLKKAPKSRQSRLEPVRTDCQIGKYVQSGLIR